MKWELALVHPCPCQLPSGSDRVGRWISLWLFEHWQLEHLSWGAYHLLARTWSSPSTLSIWELFHCSRGSISCYDLSFYPPSSFASETSLLHQLPRSIVGEYWSGLEKGRSSSRWSWRTWHRTVFWSLECRLSSWVSNSGLHPARREVEWQPGFFFSLLFFKKLWCLERRSGEVGLSRELFVQLHGCSAGGDSR